jgi:hypothetical protein
MIISGEQVSVERDEDEQAGEGGDHLEQNEPPVGEGTPGPNRYQP